VLTSLTITSILLRNSMRPRVRDRASGPTLRYNEDEAPNMLPSRLSPALALPIDMPLSAVEEKQDCTGVGLIEGQTETDRER
jgi:hypothetical protein